MLQNLKEKAKEWLNSHRPIESPKNEKVAMQEAPWLEIAIGDLSLDWNEIKGSQHNPRIVNAFRVCGYDPLPDETAWCGVYVGSRLILTGYKTPSSPAWARNYTLRVSEYGVKLKEPKIGCIVNVERGSKGGSSHVGFLMGYDDNYVKILGGNQSNTVNASLVIPRSKVLSFTWPIKDV